MIINGSKLKKREFGPRLFTEKPRSLFSDWLKATNKSKGRPNERPYLAGVNEPAVRQSCFNRPTLTRNYLANPLFPEAFCCLRRTRGTLLLG